VIAIERSFSSVLVREKLQEKGHDLTAPSFKAHGTRTAGLHDGVTVVMNESDYQSRRTGPGTWTIVAGAAAGAAAIYILRTAEGQKLLDTAIRLLEDFSREAARFQEACTRARTAASDSWQAVSGSSMSSTGGGRETVF
jgi:hypothetical protein